MKIEYVGRGFAVDEVVQQYAEEKLRKMQKFLDDPVDVHVALEIEGHVHVADVHVSHRFGALHSRVTAPQLLDAINAAGDHLATQAERTRKKFMDRRRRARRAEVAPTPASEGAAAPAVAPEA
jgi:putative sigma-54 modulation protein